MFATKHWNDLLCKFEFEGSFRSHWAFIILWWSPTACLIHTWNGWQLSIAINQGMSMEKHFPIQRGFKQGHVISPMLFNEAWNMPHTNGNLVCRIVQLILDTAKFDVYVSVQVRLHVKGKELKQIHHDGSTSSRTICCGIAFVATSISAAKIAFKINSWTALCSKMAWLQVGTQFPWTP